VLFFIELPEIDEECCTDGTSSTLDSDGNMQEETIQSPKVTECTLDENNDNDNDLQRGNVAPKRLRSTVSEGCTRLEKAGQSQKIVERTVDDQDKFYYENDDVQSGNLALKRTSIVIEGGTGHEKAGQFQNAVERTVDDEDEYDDDSWSGDRAPKSVRHKGRKGEITCCNPICVVPVSRLSVLVRVSLLFVCFVFCFYLVYIVFTCSTRSTKTLYTVFLFI